MFDDGGTEANRVGTFYADKETFSTTPQGETPRDMAPGTRESKSEGGNYTGEYNQARQLGVILLPLLTQRETLPLQKYVRVGKEEASRYASALSRVDETDTKTPADVQRAVRASIELSLRMGAAVGDKSFRRGISALAHHEATSDQVRALYTVKEAMQASRSFFNEQVQHNPKLVEATLKDFYLKQGSVVALQDEAGRRIFAKTTLESVPYAFLDNDRKDVFSSYKKLVKNIHIEAPHVSAMSALVPDKKPVQNVPEASRENRILKAIKAKLAVRQKTGASMPVPTEA